MRKAAKAQKQAAASPTAGRSFPPAELGNRADETVSVLDAKRRDMSTNGCVLTDDTQGEGIF